MSNSLHIINRYLDAGQICAATGFRSRQHMRQIMRNQIGAVKLGRRLVCSAADVAIWIERRREPTIEERARQIRAPRIRACAQGDKQ